MQEQNTFRHKRINYTKSIRQSKLQQKIRILRLSHINKQRIVSSPQELQGWINYVSQQVSKQPNENWFNVLKQIRTCYRSIQNMGILIHRDIIKNMLKCYSNKYKSPYHLSLLAQVCKTISELINYQSEINNESLISAQCIQLSRNNQQNILKYLIQLIQQILLQQQINYDHLIQLFGLLQKLSINNFNQVYKLGTLYQFIQFGSILIKSQSQAIVSNLIYYLNHIYSYLQLYTLHLNQIQVKNQQIITVLFFLDQSASYSIVHQPQYIIQKSIITRLLFIICKILQNHSSIIQSFNFTSLFDIIVTMCLQEQQQIRYMSWNCLQYLSSSPLNQTINKLNKIDADFIQLVQQGLQIKSTNKYQIEQKILFTVANIAEQSDQIKQQILKSFLIMSKIIKSTTLQYPIHNNIAAYFCLYNISYKEDGLISQYSNSPFKNKIVQCIIMGLKSDRLPPNTIQDLLNLMIRIIQLNRKDNQLVCFIQMINGKYAFEKTLQNLFNKSQDQNITKLINYILEQYFQL